MVKGYKHSEETKIKISLANKGRKVGDKLMTVLKNRTGKNNPMFGRKHTKEAKLKVKEHKLEDKNPNWKGDNCIGKDKYHEFVKSRKLKIELCENCKRKKKLDLANIKNHVYTRKLEDYKWLCRSCHRKLDRGHQKCIQ